MLICTLHPHQCWEKPACLILLKMSIKGNRKNLLFSCTLLLRNHCRLFCCCLFLIKKCFSTIASSKESSINRGGYIFLNPVVSGVDV